MRRARNRRLLMRNTVFSYYGTVYCIWVGTVSFTVGISLNLIEYHLNIKLFIVTIKNVACDIFPTGFIRFAISYACQCVCGNKRVPCFWEQINRNKNRQSLCRPFSITQTAKKIQRVQCRIQTRAGKARLAVFKEQINCGQFATANSGPHSTWHPSSGNQNELPALVCTKQPTPNCFSSFFSCRFLLIPPARICAFYRTLKDWPPVGCRRGGVRP